MRYKPWWLYLEMTGGNLCFVTRVANVGQQDPRCAAAATARKPIVLGWGDGRSYAIGIAQWFKRAPPRNARH
jgi:hypothetical protein